MIVYFTNRQLNILGQASTELPQGLIIYDDWKVDEIETGIAVFECIIPFNDDTRALVAECTKPGNYILRNYDNANEFYTITEREIDTKKQQVTIYAEDAGLDLLNEIVEAYEADKAYPITHYIEKFAYDSGFEIGVNEAASLTRKLSWDGESTAAERIASVATQFGGCEISFSFAIKGLEITHKYINIYKERGKDIGANLRLNEDIDKIVTKESIINLATALKCTGGTPEDENTEDDIEPQPITLAGYKYDDGNYYVDGVYLKSREALKKWSRYSWAKEPNQTKAGGHITRQFSYDTLSQAELFSHALTELKKACEMEVNYEVDINKLPDNIKVGDRINIIDDAGELYVSARVLKLEVSDANDEHKATLGEYLIKSSGISQKVAELAEKFAKNAQSSARALAIANKAKATAAEAQAQAASALADAQNAQQKADEATAAANTATQSAQAATEAASNAQDAVDTVEKDVEELETTVANAQAAAEQAQQAAATAETKATEAHTAAVNAQTKADEAATAAGNAQSKADSATSKADAAQSVADQAKAEAEEAATTAAAAKQDAENAQKDIDELGENLTTLENTMSADYARKTDLTEATASLQTQITQNAAEISSTATKVQEIDETANDAAEKAEQAQSTAQAAQTKADQATADAQAAQTAADNAAAAASTAQSEADKAKTAAANAQSVADKAEEDLEAAKADLATVTSRVGATEADIAAAQQAVTDAQAAADKAKADAAAADKKAADAQTTADTAVTNAATAQTKANEAASAASLAQQTADAAKGDAATAQAKADEAASAAAEAKQTADTAKTNAANAQSKADQAAADAATAQQAADDADAKAAAAQSDLNTAKQNLANVTSRVDATEEEVAAAQAAVETAQAAADKAKADAAAAQSTADTAKANAATAQTAANNAKTAADNAQTAADDAQKAADDAQADVDALAVRVTTAETKITQTSEQIALMATKKEVTETLGGYYTKEQTDSAITVKADQITQQVSQTYTEKQFAVKEVHRYYASGGGGGDTLTVAIDPSTIDPTTLVGEMFYKVSDAIVTMSDLANGFSFTASGQSAVVTSELVADVAGELADGVVFCVAGMVFISEQAIGVDVEGIAFPESGVYLNYEILTEAFSLTIPGYTGFGGGVPEKPTAFPPEDSVWAETEPEFQEGQSLYTTLCTVYNDGSFVYTDVILSSAQEAVNGAIEDISAVRETMTEQISSVVQSAESVILSALESYTPTSSLEELRETIRAELAVLANQITMNFEATSQQINDVDSDLREWITKYSKHISFDENGMTICSSNSSVTIQLDNEEGVVIRRNGVIQSQLVEDNFYTGNIVVEVNERAQFGGLVALPRSKGSLMWVKAGG